METKELYFKREQEIGYEFQYDNDKYYILYSTHGLEPNNVSAYYNPESLNVIILDSNNQMLESVFSLKDSKINDFMCYTDYLCNSEITGIEIYNKPFLQFCKNAMKEGKNYPHLYSQNDLKQIVDSLNFIQKMRISMHGVPTEEKVNSINKMIECQDWTKYHEKYDMSEEEYIINQMERNGACIMEAESLPGWYWVDYDDGSGYLTNNLTEKGIRLNYDIDEHGDIWHDRTLYQDYDLNDFKKHIEGYVNYKYVHKDKTSIKQRAEVAKNGIKNKEKDLEKKEHNIER